MAKRTAYAVRSTLRSLLPAVHVLQQLAHVVGGHADVPQDLLPARAGEVDAMGLEDELEGERCVETLLLEELPALLLDVAEAETLERFVLLFDPATLVGIPVPRQDRRVRFRLR